jgi:transposase-like protein
MAYASGVTKPDPQNADPYPEAYAMKEATTQGQSWEALVGPDPLTAALRQQARTWIEEMLHAELAAVLGGQRHERTEARQGYRHGTRPRTLATSVGPVALAVPRGRLRGAGGPAAEWQSTLLPRYARRARAVDAALLGFYCAGGNTRRLQRALQSLLGAGPVSRSAVSRVVGMLRAEYATWRTRALAELGVVYLYLDAIHLHVRVLKRVEPLPVQVAVGVLADGQKVLLDLALYAAESASAWGDFLRGLLARGLGAPQLVIADGSKGLRRAVSEVWPTVAVQRCTVHKLRNLAAHCPRRLYPALKRDYHAIVYAADAAAARRAWARCTAKWQRELPAVVQSLEEGGDELLTFYRFPARQWKSLRSTNIVERVIEEVRRRVKTQGALPSVDAVLVLCYGLIATGQLALRRIPGWQTLKQLRARQAA